MCCKKKNGEMPIILIKLEDFEIVKAIGRGGFGKVLQVRHIKENEMYAMKEMLKARVMAKKSVESVMMELELMQRIRSEFIVNVQWAF